MANEKVSEIWANAQTKLMASADTSKVNRSKLLEELQVNAAHALASFVSTVKVPSGTEELEISINSMYFDGNSISLLVSITFLDIDLIPVTATVPSVISGNIRAYANGAVLFPGNFTEALKSIRLEFLGKKELQTFSLEEIVDGFTKRISLVPPPPTDE